MPSSPLARLLVRSTERFLRHLEVDEAWREAVLAASRRGPLVYVLRNVSALDYLALRHLTERLSLPAIGFVNELPEALRPRAPAGAPPEQLRAALARGESAVLFLKRPPERVAGRGRGGEGGELLESVLRLQAERPELVLTMMPQTFVWTVRPERRGFSLVDALFGPADFPGELRMAAQFLFNFKNGRLRAGDPLSVRDFLAQEGGAIGPALVHRLTYALLRKVERERRAMLGPAQKAPDRVREEVLRSPKLQRILGELAGPGGEERSVLLEQARAMLEQLQTVPDPQAQRNLELLAEQALDRLLSGIDVDEDGIERLRDASQRGSVVLLPSHKSHLDYIVLSYVLRQHAIQTPVIAAGDNLSFFPLGPVLRRAGAFFIRRSFGRDRLYTAVVDAYVRRLLREGWLIEFFLEGGRSRTGKLLPPMLGLLNMVVAAGLGLDRPVVFLPVSIGYERLMEEGAFERELSGGKKDREDAAALLRLGSLLRERWGRVNIQFGEVIDLDGVCAEVGVPRGEEASPGKRRAVVKRLAHLVMNEINRVTALTPGALVAMALLAQGRRGVSYRDLLLSCRRLAALLLRLGARSTPGLAAGHELRETAIREALRLYVKSGVCEQHVPGDTLTAEGRRRAALYTGSDVIFTVPDGKRLRLDLLKNHVLHLLVDRALVATALLAPGEEGRVLVPLPRAELRTRVQALSRMFKYEFMYRADAPFERIFDEVLGGMVAQGELALEPAGADMAVRPGPGCDGLDGRGWIELHAAHVRNFVEAYRVAARTMRTLVSGPASEKELADRALRQGERMFLKGEIERSEAVSRPLMVSAFAAFVDMGYLERHGESFALAESFVSEAAAKAIEARVAAYLPGNR